MYCVGLAINLLILCSGSIIVCIVFELNIQPLIVATLPQWYVIVSHIKVKHL